MVIFFIKKRLLILLLILFISFEAIGQTGSARISISGEGNTTYFTFNSFEKYSNGISFTSIGSAYYIDTICNPLPCVSTGTQWELNVKANSATIIGDNGNNLPLSTIEIEIVGDDLGATYYSPIILSNIDQLLVENGTQHVPGVTYTTLTITCNVGTTTPLLGEAPDNYYVDLIFTLQKQ